MKKIQKVLVANRGEIAIRVIRACHELGLKAVAIYSKEDVYNLFRTKADEAYLVGEDKSPLGAYLDIPGIIAIAKEKNVDAIHPGYGFLAENAEFAKACEDAGIIFVGPPSDVLAQMGDKLMAKEIAKRCNVKTIPGTEKPLASLEEAKKTAAEFGYPVILKAAAGGGGRGMRKVDEESEMESAFNLVKNESKKAFGSDDIFLEKFLVEPKHIEVQVMADKYGNIVHLFERDCSVQRRYQKVVEYTPAFSVPEEVRKALYEDAIKIAREVNYVNAGTVEFLVDKNGGHYFIEMNPRIQVEHTVTEMVTGVDLVRTQVLVADGERLDSPEINIPSQDALKLNGCAIQCRVTTEDPDNNFAPDTGKITAYRSSGGFGIRLDAGNAYTGAVISPYYDSLLVKVTAFDRTFIGAIRKAVTALGEIRIRGVKTNVAFVNNVLRHPTFKEGQCHTKFIDETPELFNTRHSQDRATKVLKYIGDKIINAPGEIPEFESPKAPEGFDTPKQEGVKQILDREGPEGLKKWVLAQKKLLLCDTTFRDAHQSLLATRVRSSDMVRIAKATSNILGNAFSLEMWGGATFDVALRFLHECPWERIDELRKCIPNIPFQMLLRGANAVGYSNYPDNVIREFVRVSAEAGIDVFRVFDSLNWVPGMEIALDEVVKQGKVAEATICYTADVLDDTRDSYGLNYYLNLAKELEKRGAHFLAIKDMSGVLRPYAAFKLVKALKENIGMPVQVHTHDTSGNQVATAIMAAQAGADIVDTAIASMSSLTAQPSLNAVVAALEHTERDTGIKVHDLQPLHEYWAVARKIYCEFESDMKTPATDVYRYEIPGGQYTNLGPQVKSLGLGDRFTEVKEKYRDVNYMLGDIVKVTPSSKMVGDLAIFMVQNDLTPENIKEKGKNLNFPDSVVSYFKGMMGQPSWGFDKELQKIVLKGEEPITCRPGELLDDVDFETVRKHIAELGAEPTDRNVMSWCMYPKVYEDYLKFKEEFSDLTNLESKVFFWGMRPGDETTIDIEEGKELVIKFINRGEQNDDGTREMIFELNGARREIAVKDKTIVTASDNVVFADASDDFQIGASIPGMVSKVQVKEGDKVEKNQVVAIVEAMKMETSVVAKVDGTIEKVYIKEGQSVKAGELLIQMA
ncbi:MAG: pyruvate carboxylase [Clostridia bacterium]|nr:pyruvate carboxylase [Clostridia bacterium]